MPQCAYGSVCVTTAIAARQTVAEEFYRLRISDPHLQAENT